MKLLFKKEFSKQGKVIHKVGEVKEISEKNGTARYFLSRGIAVLSDAKVEVSKPVEKVVEKEQPKVEIPEVDPSPTEQELHDMEELQGDYEDL